LTNWLAVASRYWPVLTKYIFPMPEFSQYISLAWPLEVDLNFDVALPQGKLHDTKNALSNSMCK